MRPILTAAISLFLVSACAGAPPTPEAEPIDTAGEQPAEEPAPVTMPSTGDPADAAPEVDAGETTADVAQPPAAVDPCAPGGASHALYEKLEAAVRGDDEKQAREFYKLVVYNSIEIEPCPGKTDLLIEALRSKNFDVVSTATAFVGAHGDPSLLPHLLAAVGRGKVYESSANKAAMAEIESAVWHRIVMESLEHPDAQVRLGALQIARIELLEQATPAIIARLSKDGDDKVILNALGTLSRMSDEALDQNETEIRRAIERHLTSGEIEFRKDAIRRLTDKKNRRWADVIAEQLDNENHEIQEAAWSVLGRQGDPRWVGPMIDTLKFCSEHRIHVLMATLDRLDPSWAQSPKMPPWFRQLDKLKDEYLETKREAQDNRHAYCTLEWLSSERQAAMPYQDQWTRKHYEQEATRWGEAADAQPKDVKREGRKLLEKLKKLGKKMLKILDRVKDERMEDVGRSHIRQRGILVDLEALRYYRR